MAKNYEELDFTDDFMFGKVMADKELCRELLECLLRRPVGELKEVQPERRFCYTTDGKPIRLDVYTRDKDAMYDAEMQNLNHRKPEDLELPQRSRFYQSMMDADYLQKGNSYRRLPEGNVLFLCTFDPFGLGYPRYTFVNRCVENPELALQDNTVKIFFNCSCKREDMQEDEKELYHFIQTGFGNNRLTEHLQRAVERARRNENWRSEYMKELLHDDDMRSEGWALGHEKGLEEGIEQGRQQGIEQGIKQGRLEGKKENIQAFVKDMLEDGAEKDLIFRKVQKIFQLTAEEAEQYLV